jgi:hypothetical protein
MHEVGLQRDASVLPAGDAIAKNGDHIGFSSVKRKSNSL